MLVGDLKTSSGFTPFPSSTTVNSASTPIAPNEIAFGAGAFSSRRAFFFRRPLGSGGVLARLARRLVVEDA